MADLRLVEPGVKGEVVVPIIKASELKIGVEIGKGAFGSVFRGTCRGKEVVIKVLEGIEWSPEVMEEFMSEVNIMAQLLHGNIVLCMGAVNDLPNVGYAIVLEYMARGTLHKILHDPKIKLSLPRLIQFGIETCQGMAWLHGQKIWHRDLKPENVLVDENFVCKVADFGLSEMNRARARKRDKEDAPGSVLWMAPEVLLSEEIDCKLDVYSFALVFWEILTREELFTQYTDREIFTEDIARKGVRPPLDGIHPILQKILTKSWDRSPDVRPSFVELIELLKKAMVDIMLPTNVCPDAGKFWTKHWPGKSKVSFKSFVESYAKDIKKITKVQIECLQSVLTEEINNELVVDIERFATVLKWFGPLRVSGTTTTLTDRIAAVLKQPWFFGDVQNIEAQEKVDLYKSEPGTFLVRLNTGGSTKIEEAPFTITSSSAAGPVHVRVFKREKKDGYIIQYGKGDDKVKVSTETNFIEDLIAELMKLKKSKTKLCHKAIPGSPYGRFFREVEGVNYMPVNDDDD